MPDEHQETPDSQGVVDSRTVWRRIATVAGRQHGAIARRQLLASGLSPKAVEYRLRTARLHRVHRGVYAVGHSRLSQKGRWMAAALTVPGAVLSHGSAAACWELRPGSGAIHLTASRRAAPGRSIVVHRRALPADERTIRGGVPTTSMARTLLDLAATEGERAFERALREATFRRLTDPLGIPALIARYPGARGTAVAARALEAGIYRKRTRSELENAFLDLLREWGLPLPETNAIVEVAGRRFEVDCLWRSRGVVAELDGYGAHLTPDRAEADRERDGLLQAGGMPVHRITSRRIERDADRLQAQLRAALGLSSRRQG